MKMKKYKLFVLLIVTFLYSCSSVPSIHYFEAVDGVKADGKNRLMVQLYGDDFQNDKISIKTDKNLLIFQGSKVNYSVKTNTIENSKVLEFSLNDNVKFITVKYEQKRYRLTLNSNYSILFLDIKNGNVDAGFSNREPEYTD